MKYRTSRNRTHLILAASGIAMTLGGAANAEIILFAGSQGVVHQLDTSTGEVSFRGLCSGPVSSMVVQNGTLYLGDHNGSVYAFDVDTNIVTDAFTVPADASAMSWIADQLVVADSSGEVYYIDPVSHQVMDSVSIPSTDITAMGLDAGGMFVGGHSTLAVRSSIGQNDFNFFAACSSMINSMAFGSDIMYLGGTGFGGGQSGTIYMFDKFAGGVNYTGTHAVASDTSAMVALGRSLFIAGTDGNIHEMDPSNGQVVRVFETGINIQAMTPASGLASCPADYDASGELDFLDISRFIDLFNNRIVPADTNGDGQYDFLDISRFVQIYTGGC